jgi:PhoPQ-activated pathogenicity-related protein
MRLSLALVLLAVFASAIDISFVPDNNVKGWPETKNIPLFEYVAKLDTSFKYRDTGVVLNEDRLYGKWVGYVLNVTSQTWLSEDEVSISVWTHNLAIIVPDDLRVTDQALMYMTGWDNDGDNTPSPTSEDIILASTLATKTHVIAASMFQIPNQPIVFADDSLQMQRSEDAFVAFTWTKYLNDTTKPGVLNMLPMAKSGVRGLDTMQDFCKKKGWADIKQFIVAGASKRGWTTWMVGAVDKRVKAIMPVVMDLLHMQSGLQKHYRSLGGWSFAFKNYWDLGLTTLINTPAIPQLGTVMDVINYKQFLDIPKLVIDACGDEFFLIDDDRQWWGELPGKTWRLMVHNAEHSMATGLLSVIDSASGFLEGIMTDSFIPNFSWDIDEETGSITIKSPYAPKEVTVHSATTDPNLSGGRRDFRLLKGATDDDQCKFITVKDGHVCVNPVLWSSEDVLPVDISDGVYKYVISKPIPKKGAFTGFFAEVKFPGAGESTEFVFTTQASILPNIYPFPMPKDNDKGVLV